MNVRDESTFGTTRGIAIAGAFLLLTACSGDERPGTPPPPPPAPTYAVGGSVSGLTGSLTLLNNGGDARTITANGTFAFATSLAANAAYAVTVQTQPTNQLCTVTNGSGTIGSAAVTNVAVACETVRVTGTVGASGGTVTGPDGVQVEIPAGALDQDTTIGIARSGAGAPAAPSAELAATVLYEFTPHDIVFAKPVTIRMPYSTTGSNTPPPILMASPGTDWKDVDATYSAGVATFQRNTFSWGGPFPCTVLTGTPSAIDACVWVRGNVATTATPSSALIPMFPPSTRDPWRVTQASTLHFRYTYVLPARCVGATARIKRARSRPGGFETPAALVTEAPAPLTSNNGQPPSVSYSGSVVLDVPIDFSQNGLSYYFLQLVCTEAGGATRIFGEVQAISVEVPIPAITYPIGGTVTGLAGAGLVLRNNGADDLAVAADGAFRFSRELPEGSAYAVTVAAQPTNPAQTCTVANGAGTARAAVTSVNVSCTTNPANPTNTWRTPALIESDARPAGDVQVGMDAAGNAIAVWKASSSDPNTAIRTTEIWANRYTPASGWDTPTLLSRFTDGNAQKVSVAVSAAGGAVAAWVQQATANKAMYSIYTPNSGWSAAASITGRAEEVRAVRIAGEPSGTVFAVFTQKTGPSGTEDVWAARFAPGSGWGTPVLLEQSDSGAGDPVIAVSANGEAMAVWKQLSDTLSVNRYVNGAWGAAEPIPGTDEYTNDELAVAMDDAGRAVVAYTDDARSGFVKALRFAAGTWGAVNTFRAQAAYAARLRIAMRGTGEALIVWVEKEGLTEIWAQPYGVLGGTLATFVTGTGGQQPDVAPLPDGSFLALYAERSNDTVRARRYVPSLETWQADEVVATGMQASAPRVATDPSGRAVGLWIQSAGGGGSDVGANVYR